MTNTAQGMPCPVDGTTLLLSERSGIEIDYCPTCRGVWLDRGELDKLIERSVQLQAAAPPPSSQVQSQPWGGGQGTQSHGGYHGNRKRKKSFLEELFD